MIEVDVEAFGLAPAALPFPDYTGERDRDGLPLPFLWRTGEPGEANPAWYRLHKDVRMSRAKVYAEEIARLESIEPKAPRPTRMGVTRYTTDYAVTWGKRQGWKLLDRERFNHLTKRHHDVMAYMDALFDDGKGGIVGVQGAGRHERAAHYDKFRRWGGREGAPEKARRLGLRCIYLEFVRGEKEPILREDWS